MSDNSGNGVLLVGLLERGRRQWGRRLTAGVGFEMAEGTVGLVEAVAALRAELAEAVAAGAEADIQFPVESVQLAFQVGVTASEQAQGGLKFWVVELGGEAGWARESVQTVTITLAAPVDRRTGEPIRIARGTDAKP